jgi:hypothetical protein
MTIKKKKAGKNQNPKSMKFTSRKTPLKAASTASESSHPVFAGIGKSIGTLLDLTKAYLISVIKAKA